MSCLKAMHKLLLVLLWIPAAAWASSVDSLKTFLTETGSVKARFAQKVLDKNLKVLH